MATTTTHRKYLASLLPLMMVIASFACSSKPPPPANSSTPAPAATTATPVSPNISELANDVSKGLGSVQQTSASGRNGPIFVFEEYHTSRIGQLQIAVMLLRLHNKYGVKKIGLEGATQSGNRLDARWFHGLGGNDAAQEREDLSVRWLAEGEIGSAELMTLNFPDVEVYGIESAAEYDVEMPKTAPEIRYLYSIALQKLSTADQQTAAALVNSGKTSEAIEYIIKSDPWTSRRFETLKKQSTTSSDEEIAQVREIQDRARQVGATVPPDLERDMQSLIVFYQTADQRSVTMVNSTLALPGVVAGIPCAMTVGAAHTDKVVEELRQRDVAFAVIRPNDLNPKYGSMTGAQFNRKSDGKWSRNSLGTLAGVLNGSRKPSPIIERTAARSYASMLMAAMLLAKTARSGNYGGPFPPDRLWSQLASLPDIRIDRSSFSLDGYDVIYRAWLKQDNGSDKEVWSRAGTLTQSALATTRKTLEQKLLQASDDLRHGGGNNIPPTDLPPDSEGAQDEGPRDAKRNNLVISRVGRDSLALFAATRELVVTAGQISD